MNFEDMRQRVATGEGFIAALDQSGGSTPKALQGYGIENGADGIGGGLAFGHLDGRAFGPAGGKVRDDLQDDSAAERQAL